MVFFLVLTVFYLTCILSLLVSSFLWFYRVKITPQHRLFFLKRIIQNPLYSVFFLIYFLFVCISFRSIFSLTIACMIIVACQPNFQLNSLQHLIRIARFLDAYLDGGFYGVLCYLRKVARSSLTDIHNQLIGYCRGTAEEIKLFLGLMEPSSDMGEEFRKRFAEAVKIFKYRKINIDERLIDGKTDDEIWEIIRRIKILRDPRIKFNQVQRFPWRFKYRYENSEQIQLVISPLMVGYSFIKTTIVCLLLSVVYFLYTIFFFKIQFLKQMSIWFVIGMMYFWLMSGFNFFLKRYQFGKFTGQIQRFWKRTNTCFWLIEGFLLLLFFYYYLNSSQEPMYMYDYSALNQEYLISLYTIGFNVIILSVVIYFMYFVMLRINSNSWAQINLYLIILSIFLFFSFFIETYQFYYVISVFNERLWVLDEEDNSWGVDIDNPILRTKHQYFLVCLIAKYWHFLFIFLSWVFFLMKSFERRSVSYVLFGSNLQNMIILYVLNFACYIQWFKWIYRRFFDLPYTWFFLNIDNKFFFKLVFEMKLLMLNLLSLNSFVFFFPQLVYKSFFLWNVDSLAIWKFV